jgi:hypothetical protein
MGDDCSIFFSAIEPVLTSKVEVLIIALESPPSDTRASRY